MHPYRSDSHLSALFITLLLWISLLNGCDLTREEIITGETMGTTYRIKVVADLFQKPAKLRQAITERLDTVNQSMSVYRPDSEISRFNALTDQTPFPVSEDFFRVLKMAATLHRQTEGAWDGTVNPLMERWGFRRDGTVPEIPSPAGLQKILAQVGFNHITLHENRHISKKHPAITLDLGSIAKGYGVDQIALLLLKHKYRHFLVEIGGEVYASGKRRDGKPWRIGVNRPERQAPLDAVYQVVTLEDQALATSGDYRNFFEHSGQRYAHVLDPRTGYPVSNGVVSASVRAATCTYADGLATALMVMGPERGLALVEKLERVEALIVVQQADNQLLDYASAGWKNP